MKFSIFSTLIYSEIFQLSTVYYMADITSDYTVNEILGFVERLF